MTDEGWRTFITDLATAWPSPPLSSEDSAVYREILGDLNEDVLFAALRSLMREERESRPPPGVIRQRAIAQSAPPALPEIAPSPTAIGTSERPLTLGDLIGATSSTASPPAQEAPPSAETVATPSAVATQGLTASAPMITLLIGLVATGLGVALPWVSGIVDLAGYRTDDGQLVIGLLVVGILATIFLWPPRRLLGLGITSAILGAGTAAIGFYDGVNISRTLSDNQLANALFSTGPGVWITLVGGVIWAIGGLLLVVQVRQASSG